MSRARIGSAVIIAAMLATTGGVFASTSDTASTGSLGLESALVPGAATGSIGDLVFEDQDLDGRHDSGEPGIDGVTVRLLGTDGEAARDRVGAPIADQVTSDGGRYGFEDVPAASYHVAFEDLPAGARFADPSGDAAVDGDSDPDPGTGRAGPVDLAAGERDRTIDAGLIFPVPGLALITRVQGLDANEAPGVSLPEGSTAQFDHLVTNRGNEPLVDLTVTDDQGVPTTCEKVTIAVGQTVACSGSSPVALGQRRNVATAQAVGAISGEPVQADDPAHHQGVVAGLLVSKQVDGREADAAVDALEIAAGSQVTYSFVVANTSSETVIDIALEDVGVGPIACPKTSLAAGEQMTCEPMVATVAAGFGTNVAVVRGVGETSSVTFGSTDAANVFGTSAGLDLLKEAYDPARRTYLDADADAGSPGSNDGGVAVVEVGGDGRYRIQVTNTGNIDLAGASVTDSGCDDAPVAVVGDRGALGVLEVGEAWTLRCQRAALAESFTNDARAAAGNLEVGERARVEVVDGQPDVAIEKLVERTDGSFAPDAELDVGAVATFRIQITNTGARPLVDLAVRDLLLPDCDHVVAGPLAPGATSDPVTCTTAPLTGDLTNEAIVAAVPVGTSATLTQFASAGVTMRTATTTTTTTSTSTTTTSTSTSTTDPTTATTSTSSPSVTTTSPGSTPGGPPSPGGSPGGSGSGALGDDLVRTGSDLVGLWMTGLSLLALGILLVWSGRRRRKVVIAVPVVAATPPPLPRRR